MQERNAYRIERIEGLTTINSEAIPNQIYIVDNERKGLAIGLGDVLTAFPHGDFLIGVTREQVVDMAHELLEIAEIFL